MCEGRRSTIGFGLRVAYSILQQCQQSTTLSYDESPNISSRDDKDPIRKFASPGASSTDDLPTGPFALGWLGKFDWDSEMWSIALFLELERSLEAMIVLHRLGLEGPIGSRQARKLSNGFHDQEGDAHM